MDVYTDGSCIGSRDERSSGCGIWFGHNDSRNSAIPIFKDKHTNQHAELMAIRYALIYCKDIESLNIITDSKYSIDCLTKWASTWVKNNWVTSTNEEVKHVDVIKECLSLIEYRDKMNYITSFHHVRGHSSIEGNEEADKLAKEGAMKSRNIIYGK